MSPVKEVNVMVMRELRRNFRSVKGIVLSIMAIAGGGLASFLFVKLEEFQRQPHMPMGRGGQDMMIAPPSEEEIRALREQAYLLARYDQESATALAAAPHVLYLMLQICMWLTPMLIALIGFDCIASDMQHRAVRYWSVRSRRGSYFAAKFFGMWVTVSAITLAMSVIVWVVTSVRGDSTVGQTLGWGLRFWLVSLPVSAMWCGLATLVGSLVKHPFLALLLICGAIFGVWLVGFIGFVTNLPMMYVGPNNYDLLLLSSHPQKVAAGLAAALFSSLLFVGGGGLLFAKRDV